MSDTIHDLASIFALDALDAHEESAYEEHLASCAVCQAEVRAMREVAGLLALTVAVSPPPALRDRILAIPSSGVGASSAQAPAVGGAATAEDIDAPGIERARTRIEDGEPDPGICWLEPSAPRHRARGHAGRVLAVAAAITLVLAIAAGAVRGRSSDGADVASPPTTTASEGVLADPNARVYSLTGAGGNTGRVVWSTGRRQATLVSPALPPVESGRTYQLWFADGGPMAPGPLLADGDGATFAVPETPPATIAARYKRTMRRWWSRISR
jgi:hypothetical protein